MAAGEVCEERPVLFLYGSQTGTAEGIAQDLFAEAQDKLGVPCRLLCFDKLPELVGERVVVIVCSTTGDGEPPDNTSRWWRRMRKAGQKAEAPDLSALQYTVLGLGDTNYAQFCNMGKLIHAKLQEFGAKTFHRVGWADDGTGLELVVEPWRAGFFDALKKACDAAGTVASAPVRDHGAGARAEEATPEAAATPQEPEYPPLKLPRIPKPGVAVQLGADAAAAGDTSSVPESTFQLARLTRYRCLTHTDAVRRTLEVELQLPQGQDFCPGDAFALAAPNPKADVDELLAVLNVAPEAADGPVALTVAKGARQLELPAHLKEHHSLRQLLTVFCDLRGVLKKTAFRLLAEDTEGADDKHALQLLSSKEGVAKYKEYTQSGTTLADILRQHPSCRPSIAHVLDILPALLPRFYSASNCYDENQRCMRFLFNVVENCRPSTPALPPKRGVCTGWLDTLCTGQHTKPETRNEWVPLQASDPAAAAAGPPEAWSPRCWALCDANSLSAALVPMYRREHNTFRLPEDPSLPVVMIGPGTGLAPFLGFVEQRCRSGCQAGNVAEHWLFFGCRQKDLDLLYHDELTDWHESPDKPLSHLCLAFSRDEGADHRYVQDHISHRGKDLWRLLQEGAHVFVCGGTQMAKDVDKTLVQVMVAEGSLPETSAAAMLKQLIHSGKLRHDVWG